MKFSEIDFEFERLLTEEEEEVFISFFHTMKAKVRDKLWDFISGKNRNPLISLARALSKVSPVDVEQMVKTKYQDLYTRLDSIIILDKNDNNPCLYTFRLAMSEFDLGIVDTKVPAVQRELFNLMRNKDRAISREVERLVLPAMKMPRSMVRITVKPFDAA